jgi:ribosomal protein L40E
LRSAADTVPAFTCAQLQTLCQHSLALSCRHCVSIHLRSVTDTVPAFTCAQLQTLCQHSFALSCRHCASIHLRSTADTVPAFTCAQLQTLCHIHLRSAADTVPAFICAQLQTLCQHSFALSCSLLCFNFKTTGCEQRVMGQAGSFGASQRRSVETVIDKQNRIISTDLSIFLRKLSKIWVRS